MDAMSEQTQQAAAVPPAEAFHPGTSRPAAAAGVAHQHGVGEGAAWLSG